MDAHEIMDFLGLEPHPCEGGFFREVYRSAASFEPGPPFAGPRSHGTAIYYLLTPETRSAMHRLPGDEIFHFYQGDPVEMLLLHPGGQGSLLTLGAALESTLPMQVVPGGTWQGSRLVEGGRWALLGATMAPGFDYADYESGTDRLLREYPVFSERIEMLLPPGSAGSADEEDS
jgi:predicted cupin superfamily sugar epimerase